MRWELSLCCHHWTLLRRNNGSLCNLVPLCQPPPLVQRQASVNSTLLRPGLEPRDQVIVTDSLREVAETQANAYFSQGQPVLAACALLRTGDAMGALQKLMLGNEVLLALAVVKVLKLQFCDEVFVRAASIAEEMGLYEDALKLLSSVREPREHLTLVAARFQGPANKKAEFYTKVGIRSQDAWIQAADQAVKDGKNRSIHRKNGANLQRVDSNFSCVVICLCRQAC
jgi:hypothetical protein